MKQLVVPPLCVTEGGVCLREDPGQRVMEVIVSSELPDILLSLVWLKHSKEHVDSHLLVSIYSV